MSAGTLVEARGLEAGYAPGSAVVTGLDFAVDAGRSVAVLGPNGGGKTTLFRALLGEAPHRGGEVRLGGTPAYVPQTERARLDFPVSALDVVLMGTYSSLPWYRRLGSAQRRAASDALERVGLAGEGGGRFGTLSGGQRQRVLIARALVQDARVLLLDEPLTAPGARRRTGRRPGRSRRTRPRRTARPAWAGRRPGGPAARPGRAGRRPPDAAGRPPAAGPGRAARRGTRRPRPASMPIAGKNSTTVGSRTTTATAAAEQRPRATEPQPPRTSIARAIAGQRAGQRGQGGQVGAAGREAGQRQPEQRRASRGRRWPARPG